MAIAKARAAAYKVLYRIDQAGGYANLSLEEALRDQSLKPEDRRLATELVNGTVRYDLRLRFVLEQYLTKGGKRLPNPLIIILKLALYQLLFLDRIPVYAVINDAVEQTSASGLSSLKAVTNGVLRAVAREKDQIVYPDRNQDMISFLSVFYSHPRWLVERWLDHWGDDYTEQLLAFNNSVPPVTLRVNNLKITRDRLQADLAGQGIDTSAETITPWALRIISGSGIVETTSYRSGHFYIQDEASMLVAAALEPRPGQAVIDACAGVGGKSTMLAQMMNDEGEITALELYDNKLRLLEANCTRLGIHSVRAWGGDAISFAGPRASAVLLDAPCSGLGVLRRRADARYRRSQQDIVDLSALQSRLLDHCADLVEPGGILAYSTCTMEPEENELVVDGFLSQHKEYEPLGFPEVWQQIGVVGVKSQGPGWLLDPLALNIDGMFVARLRRKQ